MLKKKLFWGLLAAQLLVIPIAGSDLAFADDSRMIHVESAEDMEQYMYLTEEYATYDYDELPIKYPVAITLTRISEIDKTVGSYEADFWFWIEIFNEDSPIDFTKDPPKFDFTNARDISMDSEYIEPHYYEIRVRGTFFNEMDFSNFPFEKLNLVIEVEPQAPYMADQIQLVLDPNSGIDHTAKVPGWSTGEFDLTVEDYAYEEDEVFSRYTATFAVERSPVGSFLTNILPISLITGLSLVIFFIPENYTPRIYLTAPLLLSLIYLHQNALHEIPSVGYMTILDKLMMINFALFVNAIGSLAIQMRFHVMDGNSVRALKANNTMRLFIPVIIAVGILFIVAGY
jgi:hypothetical protein